MTCLDLFRERHFAQKHRNVKYCTLIPRIRAFSLINHAITVLIKRKKEKKAIVKKYCVKRLIVSYVLVINCGESSHRCASGFGIWVQFFFIRRSRFIDPLDFMVRKLLPDPVY